MKSIKIILSLLLMLTLPMVTFAAPPRGHKPPPPKPHHHDHHHHHHHDYYYSSSNSARDAIFVLLGLSAITAVAVAASQSSKKNKEKVVVVEEHYEKVSQDLTLTQEQQDQVRKLFDTNREKLTPIRDEKALKTIALEQEKEKENPDQALVNKLENEISQLSMSIFRITQDTKKELQTILTPAQYEAMEEMKL
jgi:Spy/CpxP family protein refolding chaperone